MKNKKGLQSRDVFERMNFLYQASMLMAGKNDTLSAYYGLLLKNVGKKSVLRIEPDIKRIICKKCGLCLKSGLTCEVKIDEKCRNFLVVKCKICNSNKKFQINSKYKLWLEDTECVVEMYKGNNQYLIKS